MQDNAFTVTDFLIHQKVLDVGSLVTGQLDDFTDLVVLLNGTVATEILLEGLANSLDVQIVRQPSYSCNTFSSISLLDANVHLFLGVTTRLVSGILKCICKWKLKQRRQRG